MKECENNQEASGLIIGTAGHVDHGKTTLIKALTGTNTDRLKEEQERGLTIDIGFARILFPSGRTAGIVDVPGHERFLKNMLAGATGIDVALLVIAADEGIMPQTVEHLQILQLLDTPLGVVALTKCDMVDTDWLDLVEDDIRLGLADTFLASSGIIRTSGTTGQGIPDLIEELDRLSATARRKSKQSPFRLPVDRVFTMQGFGTVVTGTLVSGTVRTGDPVVVLPQGIESRVRTIHVHGEKTETATAGNRTALNLAGVEVADIERGDVIAPPGYLKPSRVIDTSITIIKEAGDPLKSRQRIRFHTGTSEVLGRAGVIGADSIEPGHTGFCQFRMEAPIATARGDGFVIRSYSPQRVIGGGVVLNPDAPKHKKKDCGVLERLARAKAGSPEDLLIDAISQHIVGIPKSEAAGIAGLEDKDAAESIESLLSDNRLVAIGNRIILTANFDLVSARIKEALGAYHSAYPSRSGMPREELKAKIDRAVDTKAFNLLMEALSRNGSIKTVESVVCLADHTPRLSPELADLGQKIEGALLKDGMNPPSIADITADFGKDAREVLSYLIDSGTVVKISPELIFHKEPLRDARSRIEKYLADHQKATVADIRDITGSSRKYVVPLLEYFDSIRLTRRMGDYRVLGS